jgi:hypothetical protein
MWKALRPEARMWKKMMLALVMFIVGVLAFSWGRHGALSEAKGNPPGSDPAVNGAVPAGSNDYNTRVVAFIYNNIPISREELGEYLIARFGKERVEFLVNRRIIEMECKARNINITDAEVDFQLEEDLKSFGPTKLTREQFVNQVLRRFNKTLYEWKEDVIRPKLALSRLAAPRVTVSEKDLHDGFEARYGKKVECRMIVLQEATPPNVKTEIWTKVRKDEAAFEEEARKQFIPALAQNGGKVPPIHQHFGDPKVEQIAFNLKPGEVSEIIGMPDKSFVILKCDKHLPPDTTKNFDNERMALQKEIFEIKLQQEIPKVFKELRDHANPTILLRDQMREVDLVRDVTKELKEDAR